MTLRDPMTMTTTTEIRVVPTCLDGNRLATSRPFQKGDRAMTDITYFDTSRLRVYRYPIPDFPEDGADPLERALFVAFALNDSIVPYPPVPLVTVSMYCWRDKRKWTVAWMETSSDHRRSGFGREVLLAIADRLGDAIHASGATKRGTAFCGAMEDTHPMLHATGD